MKVRIVLYNGILGWHYIDSFMSFHHILHFDAKRSEKIESRRLDRRLKACYAEETRVIPNIQEFL